MNKRIAALCLLLSGVMVTGYLVADPGTDTAIRKALAKVLPSESIDAIKPSPMAGISEVMVGMNIFYVSNDGKYLMQGKLIEMASRTDLTEQRLGKVRLKSLADVGEKSMIVFPAKQQRHTITVFTDIDCGYCRKLHNEMAAYNAEGITVRYLSFPRSGPNSPSFDKAVSVWCADDRNDAMTRAKTGGALKDKKCDNPVNDHINLGVAMGVRGTPAILMEDGSLLPGYVPAKKLVKQLDSQVGGKS